jgi:hypothetical protein
MDHGSTEWVDGLLQVMLAMNTQKHSSIGCAPAELLFRERSTYLNWLNTQKRLDPTIGIAQEDPTLSPIRALSPQSNSSRIDIGIQSGTSQITMRISPETGPEISLQITPPARSSPIEEWFDIESYSHESGHERRLEPAAGPVVGPAVGPVVGPAVGPAVGPVVGPAAGPAVGLMPELGPESGPVPESGPESGSELGPESEPELEQDIIVQKARKATQSARIRMAKKYSKRHDIQHFEVGAIVSIKVPREDRTSTDNKRLFARILEEPHSHRYKVITMSGIINRLIPTKGLGVVEQALWSDITIPDTRKEVALGHAAREASTSQRVGISCQCKGLCNTKRCRCFKESKECSVHCHRDEHDCGNLSGLAIRTEIALVERPRRKRARADTVGNTV